MDLQRSGQDGMSIPPTRSARALSVPSQEPREVTPCTPGASRPPIPAFPTPAPRQTGQHREMVHGRCSCLGRRFRSASGEGRGVAQVSGGPGHRGADQDQGPEASQGKSTTSTAAPHLPKGEGAPGSGAPGRSLPQVWALFPRGPQTPSGSSFCYLQGLTESRGG